MCFRPESADLLLSVDDGSAVSDLPGAVSLDDALAQGNTDHNVTAPPDDLLMICTGGTTGRPKGVLWRQSDIYVSSMLGADHESAQEIHDKVSRAAGPPWFAVSPLMHAAGMWTAFAAIMAGTTVVLYDTRRKLDPRAVWQTAEREKVGMMTMVGDAYAAPLVEELRRGRYDLSSLNAIGTGGAATNPKYQRALLELLPHMTLINGYGSSETGNMGFGNSQGDTRTDTFTLREGGLVLSEDYSRFLRPGEREIGWAAREGRIPLGYFNDPDATRKTFPEVDGKRVVISGDRASLEEDGTLRLFGRDSLVVNTGGEKVFVEEVEEVLRAHPSVADALVVGRPSGRWGEELVALVELRDGADAARELLHAHCSFAAGTVQGAQGVHLRRAGPSPGQWQGRLPMGEISSDRKGADVDMNASPVIDCLVNVHFGETEKQPTWMLKVRDDYFKGPESMFAPVDLAELLDEMDEQGVRKAVLMDNLTKPSVTARKFVEAKPDRFALAMGGVNLLRPMPSLRELSAVVNDLPVVYTVVGPSFWGDGQYPPSDAVYYPLYTKCAELGLPLCINTGIPGPPIPGEVQNPIHLDRVCVRFPELKLCMIHGADPWWDIAIRLLIKYTNLRLMTSAWSPKRLPESLLHYMRTRGNSKVIYASDWPVLKMRRVVPEAQSLDLPADVLENYLYNNAHEFFFQGQEEH